MALSTSINQLWDDAASGEDDESWMSSGAMGMGADFTVALKDESAESEMMEEVELHLCQGLGETLRGNEPKGLIWRPQVPDKAIVAPVQGLCHRGGLGVAGFQRRIAAGS